MVAALILPLMHAREKAVDNIQSGYTADETNAANWIRRQYLIKDGHACAVAVVQACSL
jgi:hypothetical protein